MSLPSLEDMGDYVYEYLEARRGRDPSKATRDEQWKGRFSGEHYGHIGKENMIQVQSHSQQEDIEIEWEEAEYYGRKGIEVRVTKTFIILPVEDMPEDSKTVWEGPEFLNAILDHVVEYLHISFKRKC